MLASDHGVLSLEMSHADREWRERMDVAEEIDEILLRFARERTPGAARSWGAREVVRLAVVDHAAGRVRWEAAQGQALSGQVVEFCRMNVVYQVPVGALDSSLSGPFPTSIFRVVRRRHRRARALGHVFVRFDRRSPFFELGVRPVTDISQYGLALLGKPYEDMAGFQGASDDVALVSGAECARVRILVRNVRASGEDGRWTLGMSFEPVSRQDAAIARRLVEHTLYPTSDDKEADLWMVHQDSGYLELSGKQPADFHDVRPSYMRSVAKIANAPEVGHVLHWPRTGTPDGTMSLFKLYQSTWFMCQLSKRRGLSRERSKICLRDLYIRALERQYTDPDGRWLLIYAQHAAPAFSTYVHIELTKRFTRTGEGCLLPMRAFEVATRAPTASAPSAYRVLPTDEQAALGAMRALCLVRPAQYLDALDLNERRWDLGENRLAWRSSRMQRERELLIAYQGNTCVALAVLEVAEPGLHLYGLPDCLRMFPLRPGGQAAFPALLDEARRWFLDRGRAQFVYCQEFAEGISSEREGFRDLGGATLALLSLDRVPEIMERMTDFTAVRFGSGPATLGGSGASSLTL